MAAHGGAHLGGVPTLAILSLPRSPRAGMAAGTVPSAGDSLGQGGITHRGILHSGAILSHSSHPWAGGTYWDPGQNWDTRI